MQLCFFEDQKSVHFHPLTLTRPLDDLRIGIFTITEKWARALSASRTARILRPELQEVFDSGTINAEEHCLWINSRYLPSKKLLREINDLGEGQCLRNNATIIAARVSGTESWQWLEDNKPNFNNLFVLETPDFLALSHLWDLFQLNGNQILADINLLGSSHTTKGTVSEHAVLECPENIIIEEGATIEAGCVLNAQNGPIYIGTDTTVMSGSHIRGPVAVGEKSTIQMGARIYADTTIGPHCKVGGEVNNSIFHSYSNKAHDGYMGNSLIGQWCNIGADTNTSNLKNNYSTIRITDWEQQEEIETGQQFFGAVIADHTKTAINTQLNTGTICGVSCNIFSADFPPKFIPSFSWVGSNVIQSYRLDKAFEAMEAMMSRRNISMDESYRKMMELLFQNSRSSL